MPLDFMQALRLFSKSYEMWLGNTITCMPQTVFEIKMEVARAFCTVLKRRTFLNHLAQAARSVLQNPSQVRQMYEDWLKIDFDSIREQSGWVCQFQENILELCHTHILTHFQTSQHLEDWTQWLEGIVTHCVSTDLEPSKFSFLARQVLMKGSYYMNMILRELTIRSSPSFGAFHLCRLFFEESLYHIIEKQFGFVCLQHLARGRIRDTLESTDVSPSFVFALEKVNFFLRVDRNHLPLRYAAASADAQPLEANVMDSFVSLMGREVDGLFR